MRESVFTFDVDIVLIHDIGNFLTLERFMLHYMTPALRHP